MTRAVFLPFTGDPFLLRTWLTCFDIWKDEIDKLYVMLNVDVPPEVYQDCASLLKKYCQQDIECKVFLLYENHLLDHGPALNEMLDICVEDLVLLVEEDGFIFKKGVVDKCFKMIEEGKTDIVASPRGSCSKEIYEKAEKIWGTPAQAPNFWPNFFFISCENLLRTDRHFHAKSWNKGDYIKELDLTITDEVAPADTFVWVSIQLRSMGLRVHLTEQYHSFIEDIQDKVQIRGIFDRKCPWVHIGSLSGWQNVLLSANLQFRLGEVEEWERRAGAWLMFWENSQGDLPESLKEYSDKYKSGIDRLINEYTLSPARVKERAEIYRELINPELHKNRQEAFNKI